MIHAYHGATISSPHVMIRCDRIEAKTLHKLHAKFHIVTKFVWHYRGNERKPKWFQSAERWLFKQNICRVCRVGRWALVKKLLKIACFIRVTVKVYCWNPAVAHFFNKGSAKHILPDSGQSCSFLPELATKKTNMKRRIAGRRHDLLDFAPKWTKHAILKQYCWVPIYLAQLCSNWSTGTQKVQKPKKQKMKNMQIGENNWATVGGTTWTCTSLLHMDSNISFKSSHA